MTFANRRRLLIAVLAGAGVLIVLVGMGVFGLLRGPAGSADDHEVASAALTTTPVASRAAPATPRPLAETSDPERFARAVARALYDWDTRTPDKLSEWVQPIIDAAEPDEQPGVAADVRAYLPPTQAWEQLSAYSTQQTLRIESLRAPDAWATALAQASAEQIPRTATALTVTGTAERAGIWNQESVTSARRVAFTVFLDCPDDSSCRLLRLSRPDAPLR
ncbi:hypothetical protein GE115_02750 [Agromyces sp. CFH 90414]|uniref:Uncharacterized protein n=1 Tax=Agromyces agglutinans TaxID=2662258 RepID=A0A6I2F8V0_9MICO|nr:hypothetical protein [Agromyces agglutinans]MRG58796.1 hypothetical protein [Agromyces agglutinans]